MISNSTGQGKSSLVQEYLNGREKFSNEMNMMSGPVLFTDFSAVQNVTEAEAKVSETIRSLFLSFDFMPTGDHGI